MSSETDFDVDALIEEGLRRYGLGEADAALELWQRALHRDSGNSRLLEYISYVERAQAARPSVEVEAPPRDIASDLPPAEEPLHKSDGDFEESDWGAMIAAHLPEQRSVVVDGPPVAPAVIATVAAAPVELEPIPVPVPPAMVELEPVELEPLVVEGEPENDEPEAMPAPSLVLAPPDGHVEDDEVDVEIAVDVDMDTEESVDDEPPAPPPAPEPDDDDAGGAIELDLGTFESGQEFMPPPTTGGSTPEEQLPSLDAPTRVAESLTHQIIEAVETAASDEQAEPFSEASVPPDTDHGDENEPSASEEEIPLGAPIGDPKVVDQGQSQVNSPWDAISGATAPIDLDAQPQQPSVFDMLLAAEKSDKERSGPYAAPDLSKQVETPAPVAAAEEAPEADVDECRNLMEGARELFELGDFSGSLALVEKVLELDADNPDANEYFERNEVTLIQMYESKLGDLTHSPQLLTAPDEVIWMNLHHRAGFLLSQVDGEISYEDIAAVSGMTRLETFRILADLVSNGVIG